MSAVRFFVAVVAATCLLGVAVDLVTAHVAVEYFTVHHPHVVDSESPVVMALIWGIGASWWAGAVAAGVLIVFNARRPNPLSLRIVLRWVCFVLAFIWIAMMIVLVGVYLLANLVPIAQRGATFDQDRRLMSVAMAHSFEYLFAAVGVAVLMLRMSKLTGPAMDR